MNSPIRVLSVGSAVLGNAVYHANMCGSLSGSRTIELTRRSVSDYWGLWAKLMFATFASPRFGTSSYRYRAEWVASEVVRRGISREMAANSFDVIHCHTQAHALRCGTIAKSTPFVVTMDATASLLNKIPAHADQTTSFRKLSTMEKSLFSACAATGGVSKWVTTSLQADYGMPTTRIHLCSPCVDTGFFSPSGNLLKERASKKIRVVFVGNDLERKGGSILLDLMARGLSEVCELHIVSGAKKRELLPEGVSWHQGIKPGTPELVDRLRDADVFALPTLEDCFPQALVEAMSCGLPLIGTRVMGVPELVQDGVNGFCIEPGDERATASAIRALAGDAGLRSRFAMEGRRIAEEMFSFTSSRRTWEAVFEKSATSASSPKPGRKPPGMTPP